MSLFEPILFTVRPFVIFTGLFIVIESFVISNTLDRSVVLACIVKIF